jgi:hypothetical protein
MPTICPRDAKSLPRCDGSLKLPSISPHPRLPAPAASESSASLAMSRRRRSMVVAPQSLDMGITRPCRPLPVQIAGDAPTRCETFCVTGKPSAAHVADPLVVFLRVPRPSKSFAFLGGSSRNLELAAASINKPGVMDSAAAVLSQVDSGTSLNGKSLPPTRVPKSLERVLIFR